MVDLNKLFGAASKALGSSGSGKKSGKGGSGDWKDMVRKVADQVTGDSRQGQSQQSHGGHGQQAGGYSQQGYPQQQSPRYDQAPPRPSAQGSGAHGQTQVDRAAIAKYDYLLKTAAPDQLEQAHREAFERLTPAQRQQVQERISAEGGPYDRPQSSSPSDLARAATRGEVQKPGFMKRVLGTGSRSGGSAGGRGRGMAGVAAGVGAGALGGIALGVVGGAVASAVAAPLLMDAVASGLDFDGMASAGIEGFEGLTADVTDGLAGGMEGLTGGVEEFTNAGGEAVSGLGEQVSGFGDQLGEFGSGFGLDDLFGR